MFTRVLILFDLTSTEEALISVSVEYVLAASSEKPSAIVYPGPVQQVTENRHGNTEDEVPDKCKSLTYCAEKPTDYPQEQFNTMFKNLKFTALPQPMLIISDHGVRLGDDDGDGCESDVSFEPLYKVREKRGSWRTVVQVPEANYVQQVRLETCRNPKSACFEDFPNIPGINTFCKQKTSMWQFLVSDDKGGSEMLEVELPICCACHYNMAK